jgi:photosystem II stability/assembly factor-like uncharacterized protein
MKKCFPVLLLPLLLIQNMTRGQEQNQPVERQAKTSGLTSEQCRSLELRALGPAVAAGRVSDIAIDPRNRNIWYVSFASSGLWKTTNRGITWIPVFDDGGSYSLGCLAIDPKDPNIVWLGTGENQASRSASFGDGVYKSTDAGRTWKNMGLPNSEHIAKFLIDPRNSNVVYVASQGPLWSPGGDRGLYKSTDAGQTWESILTISENTGITDIVFDPRNPDVIYAASYQRRRNVGILIGGGPEAGIYKTEDAGQNWKKLTNGIPTGDLGRIALAVSPQNPDIVYALIVAAGDESGFFRSADCGQTWVRQCNYRVVDPQYYGELYPDPHRFDCIYAADVRMHLTNDGGKTFEPVSWRTHVDNHALVFDPTDPDYLLLGNDGGLYETFDGGQNWRRFTNLPTIQYYRVGLDNTTPFYNVYGGSQDNGSHGGPSRTVNRVGIRTSEWYSVAGGDGMQPRVDPENPNIVYTTVQYGQLTRLDLSTGTNTRIMPPEDENEPVRWNWNPPLIISPHSAARIYIAASRLFRSDDRGDNWTCISPDLTRQIDRDSLPVMGKVWGPDAITKNLFTSPFGVATAMSESPLQENLLYVGTDDGLIQVTEDGGKNWRKIESFPGVPEMTLVSDLFASSHDRDTIYAAFENHKRGDFRPYLLKSTDKGRTWTSIAGGLPDRHCVWSIVEDYINSNLLLAGTEFGLFFSIDGGTHWTQLKGNVPVIAFRDLEIQKREDDLVCATFGRGFYILDDFSPLRGLNPETLAGEGTMLPMRHAYLFNELSYVRATEDNYTTPNPPSGALLTYYLPADFSSQSSEAETGIVLTIADDTGKTIRKINGDAAAGLHRLSWDLRTEPAQTEQQTPPLYQFNVQEEGEEEFEFDEPQPQSSDTRELRGRNQGAFGARRGRRGRQAGPPVEPGKFTVTLNKLVDGNLTPLGKPQTFDVVPLPDNSSTKSVKINVRIE